MVKKLLQVAIVVAGGLALGGCPLQQASTAAPGKAPANDYQAPGPPSPPAASTRSACYNTGDLAVYRARMVQMELNVATLQCQTTSGSRAYEPSYAAFVAKFQSELTANGQSLQQLARRKRLNVDLLVTEFANRTAQVVQVDKEFCARSKRAFDWALSSQVTSLAQVPPPYDLGPAMNVYPCPAP